MASKHDTALEQAVEALESLLREGVPHPDQGEVMAQLQACAEQRGVSKAALDKAIRRLAAFAEPLDLMPATYAVFGCGLCIENGGDAEPAVAVTLRFAKESVRHAAALFCAAVKASSGKAGGFVWEELCLYLSEGRTSPLQVVGYPECSDEERVAANMYIFLSPALLNVLSQSKAARRLVRADDDFMRDVAVFSSTGDCPEAAVSQILAQNDDDEDD